MSEGTLTLADPVYNTWDDLNRATPFAKTQPAWLRAAARLTLLDAIPFINAARVASYKAAFADYKANRDNRPDVTPGPAPEPAFALIMTTDQYGNPVEGTSKDRVCPTETYVPPVQPELGHGKVGNMILPPDWFECLPGDTTPHGVVIPGVSKDGIAGLFQKIASPIQSSSAGQGGQVLGWFQKKG